MKRFKIDPRQMIVTVSIWITCSSYQCNCYVLVCGPDELERRTLKTGRDSGKWVPVTAVMDMKRNFTLPDAKKERWNSVHYVEMDEESSRVSATIYIINTPFSS